MSTKRVLASTFLAAVLANGCVAGTEDGARDERDDSFVAAGKADGLSEGSLSSRAALKWVNQASIADLTAAGISATVSDLINAVKIGDDGVAGTEDDLTYTTLAQLDAVPYVGASVFAQIATAANTLLARPELETCERSWVATDLPNTNMPSTVLSEARLLSATSDGIVAWTSAGLLDSKSGWSPTPLWRPDTPPVNNVAWASDPLGSYALEIDEEGLRVTYRTNWTGAWTAEPVFDANEYCASFTGTGPFALPYFCISNVYAPSIQRAEIQVGSDGFAHALLLVKSRMEQDQDEDSVYIYATNTSGAWEYREVSRIREVSSLEGGYSRAHLCQNNPSVIVGSWTDRDIYNRTVLTFMGRAADGTPEITRTLEDAGSTELGEHDCWAGSSGAIVAVERGGTAFITAVDQASTTIPNGIGLGASIGGARISMAADGAIHVVSRGDGRVTHDWRPAHSSAWNEETLPIVLQNDVQSAIDARGTLYFADGGSGDRLRMYAQTCVH